MNTKQFNYQNRPQWQADLINKYPLIYRVPNPRLKEYFNEETYQKLINDPFFCNLRFGFECDEGWADLIGKYSNAAFEVLHILEKLYPGNFDSGKYYIRAFITQLSENNHHILKTLSPAKAKEFGYRGLSEI